MLSSPVTALKQLLCHPPMWRRKATLRKAKSTTQRPSSNCSSDSTLEPTYDSVPDWIDNVPKSTWMASCHPLVKETTQEIHRYYLKNWPFPSEAARIKFVNSDFTSAVCWNYPEALDGRIGLACRLITLLFLIDDVLEYMSLEDGRIYNEKLMPLMRGDTLPDREAPVEWITYDLWAEMRECDKALTNPLLEPTFMFMRAQTDPFRLTKMSFGEYLEYRDRDVGADLVTVLGRFSMGLDVPVEDLALAVPLDKIYSKHLSIVNDIWSYDKEVKASKEAHTEGGFLCNSVAILAADTGVSEKSAKRTLYFLCREWERRHEELTDEMLRKKDTPELRLNARGMRYQMAGNEKWSTFTKRYNGKQ